MPTESITELVKIAPDTYTFRYINHVAPFIVTDAGVILVDAIGGSNPETPSLLKQAIRQVTDQPVKYFVYSHAAADHATGGAVFTDTAQFVAQRNAVDKIAALNSPVTPAPMIIFDDEMPINLGGKHVTLYWAKQWAEDDYLVLHHPESKVVVAVDIIQARNVPFRTLFGHPDIIPDRMQWLHDLGDWDMLIAGHATPQLIAAPSDVLEQKQYYFDLTDAIAAARAVGLADNSAEMIAAVQKTLGPKYSGWRNWDPWLADNIAGMIKWRAESA